MYIQPKSFGHMQGVEVFVISGSGNVGAALTRTSPELVCLFLSGCLPLLPSPSAGRQQEAVWQWPNLSSGTGLPPLGDWRAELRQLEAQTCV